MAWIDGLRGELVKVATETTQVRDFRTVRGPVAGFSRLSRHSSSSNSTCLLKDRRSSLARSLNRDFSPAETLIRSVTRPSVMASLKLAGADEFPNETYWFIMIRCDTLFRRRLA